MPNAKAIFSSTRIARGFFLIETKTGTGISPRACFAVILLYDFVYSFFVQPAARYYCAVGRSASVRSCARVRPVPSTSLSRVSSDAFTSQRSILP